MHDNDGVDHPRFWWACEFPERLPDPWVRWEWACDRCMMCMEVAAIHYGDMYADARVGGTVTTDADIERMYRKAMEWRRANGMTTTPPD